MNNAAADPAYAAQKSALADELMAKLMAAHDPRVVGNPVPYDLPPFTNADDERKPASQRPLP